MLQCLLRPAFIYQTLLRPLTSTLERSGERRSTSAEGVKCSICSASTPVPDCTGKGVLLYRVDENSTQEAPNRGIVPDKIGSDTAFTALPEWVPKAEARLSVWNGGRLDDGCCGEDLTELENGGRRPTMDEVW